MTSALLVEHDEALGHWLCAVLGESGYSVTWMKDATSAIAAVATEVPALVIVEGVVEGQGVELCALAKTQGAKTLLLIPRGAHAMSDVTDRILEHPLTRTGLLETLAGLLPSPKGTAPAPAAAPVAEKTLDLVDETIAPPALDRLRMGEAALSEGRLDAAVIELEAAAVLAPAATRPRLLATWARYARLRGAVSEAARLRAALGQLAERIPTAEALYFRAAAAFDFGERAQAAELARAAQQKDAGHVQSKELLEMLLRDTAT